MYRWRYKKPGINKLSVETVKVDHYLDIEYLREVFFKENGRLVYISYNKTGKICNYEELLIVYEGKD